MSKKPDSADPTKPIQDMSVPEIAKMQLHALRTGDLSEVEKTLQASIPPEPARQEPVRVAFRLPITHRGGERAVGQALLLSYDGDGDQVTLFVGDEIVRVSAARLAAVASTIAQMTSQSVGMPSFLGPRPY